MVAVHLAHKGKASIGITVTYIGGGMTAKKAKRQNGVRDLKPRSIKSGSNEAGAIKGGTHNIDKSSPVLMQQCTTGVQMNQASSK